MDLQKTGRSISSLRKEHGWTQKDLAERVGVTDKAVSRWETGRGSPDVSYLTALADVLEVSISELVLGERIGSAGKNPAEIVEQADQAVVGYIGVLPGKRSQRPGSRRWYPLGGNCYFALCTWRGL